MLKSLLLTLQKDLPRELHISLSKIHHRVDCLKESTDTLEKHVSEMSKAWKQLLHAHDHHSDEIQKIKLKLTDLKDRSKQNNIKFRGIPETVHPNELKNTYNNFLLPSRHTLID